MISETNIPNPKNPYAVSKYAAYQHGKIFRQSHNVFISNAILFNHESELRPKEFVTRKITSHVAENKLGDRKVLEIGNLEAQRDWGYAGDFVEAMHKILSLKKADDFVIATAERTSVRDFINYSFEYIGKNIKWEGKGIDEVGYDEKNGEVLVKVNSEFFRPIDQKALIGDSSKLKKVTKWKAKVKAKNLAELMVKNDINLLNANS